MTTIGTPDFQEQGQWQSGTVQSESATVIAANNTLQRGPFPCSSWQSTELFFQVGGGPVQIEVDWYTDATQATEIGQRVFTVQSTLSVSVVNLGPFCVITYTAGGSQISLTGTVTFSNRGGQPWVGSGTLPFLNVRNKSVAGGGTDTEDVLFAFNGAATWYLESTANSWSAFLQSVDRSGNATHIAALGPVVGTWPRPQVLQSARSNVVNGNAALVAAPGVGRQIYVVSAYGISLVTEAGPAVAVIWDSGHVQVILDVDTTTHAFSSMSYGDGLGMGDNHGIDAQCNPGNGEFFVCYYVAETAPAALGQSVQLILPPTHLQLVFNNYDAGAQTFTSTLTPAIVA